MKPRTTNLIAAFFKTILYSVMLGFIIFFFACFMLSCSTVYKPCTSGEKVCRVIEKKFERGHYYSYTCLTLFSKEKVYVAGFKMDANVNDTLRVVVQANGFNYFKKGY